MGTALRAFAHPTAQFVTAGLDPALHADDPRTNLFRKDSCATNRLSDWRDANLPSNISTVSQLLSRAPLFCYMRGISLK